MSQRITRWTQNRRRIEQIQNRKQCEYGCLNLQGNTDLSVIISYMLMVYAYVIGSFSREFGSKNDTEWLFSFYFKSINYPETELQILCCHNSQSHSYIIFPLRVYSAPVLPCHTLHLTMGYAVCSRIRQLEQGLLPFFRQDQTKRK